MPLTAANVNVGTIYKFDRSYSWVDEMGLSTNSYIKTSHNQSVEICCKDDEGYHFGPVFFWAGHENIPICLSKGVDFE